jgi:hypothetical protein
MSDKKLITQKDFMALDPDYM